jgi:hypothetical protein
VFYGSSKADAAQAGFDDQFIYEEIEKPLSFRSIPMEQLLPEEAMVGFEEWAKQEGRKLY